MALPGVQLRAQIHKITVCPRLFSCYEPMKLHPQEPPYHQLAFHFILQALWVVLGFPIAVFLQQSQPSTKTPKVQNSIGSWDANANGLTHPWPVFSAFMQLLPHVLLLQDTLCPFFKQFAPSPYGLQASPGLASHATTTQGRLLDTFLGFYYCCSYHTHITHCSCSQSGCAPSLFLPNCATQ